MRYLLLLLVISLITTLVSCGRLNGKKKQPAAEKDSQAIQPAEKAEERPRSEQEWDDYNRADSIRMDGVLKEAMDLAYKSIQTARFKKEFPSVPDSFYFVETTLAMEHFFSNRFTHLIVQRKNPGDTYYDIYIKQKDSFVHVLSHKQDDANAPDTLLDVNGDGMKDYLINWYGNIGCCLKNFYAVYLYRPQTGTFSEMYTFINPTFSAKEKVIRGVEYGHPGETSMYKYRWNGLQVDSLESIYFEKNDIGEKTGKIIRNIVLNNNWETTRKQKLNQAPAEYRRIYGYDWFLGKF